MGISLFQISRSNFARFLDSTMVIKVVLMVVTLLVAVEGRCYWSDAECDWDMGCSYGCKEGSCWSQCNGVCLGTRETCGHCPEWCWLSGDSTCSQDSDCKDVRRNSCAGGCSVV